MQILFRIAKLYMHTETLQLFYVALQLVNLYNSISKVNNALVLYKNEILNDIENICSPYICIIAEKGCNNGCFDPLLGKESIGIFNKVNKKLVFNRKLTEEYLKGNKLPKNFNYAVLSPYLDVESLELKSYFYYNHNIKTQFTGKTKKLFFEIFNCLKDTRITQYENKLIKFKASNAKGYIHYHFNLDGIGCMHSVEFWEKNEIFDRLINIKKEISKWKTLEGSVLIDKTTTLLLKMLKDTGILLQEPDLELYPEFIKLIFPYKMLSLANGKKLKNQLMCIGVDLTNVEKSNLSFLFNLKKHNLKYFISFDVKVM